MLSIVTTDAQRLQAKYRPLLLIIVFIVTCSTLFGCAYRRMWGPGDGGYSDKQIGHDTFEIIFRGPTFFSYERCESYALLRAAELTLERSKTHFEVLTSTKNSTEYPSPPSIDVDLKGDDRGGYTSESSIDPFPGYSAWLPSVHLVIRLHSTPRGISAIAMRNKVRSTM